MFENLNELINRNKELKIPAFDLVVYHEGKQVFRYQHGTIDFEGTPVSDKTLYNVYSCTKPITCVGALTLLEKGKFSLEDDLAMYIPAFKDMQVLENGVIRKAKSNIKVKHLFTMSSGLDYNVWNEEIKKGQAETDGKCQTLEMMNYVAKMPLAFEPGEKWLYGLSHDVLGALIEAVSGITLGEYLRKEIFDKVGMEDATFFLPKEKMDRLCDQYNHAEGYYRYVGKGNLYVLGSQYECGGAGLICSVNDYIKFLEGVRTYKILNEQTVRLLSENNLNEKQKADYSLAPLGYGYGLGFRVPAEYGKRTDIGWNGAAGASASIDIKNKISLYFGMHVMTAPNTSFRPDLIECAKLDLGFEADVKAMNKNLGKSLA